MKPDNDEKEPLGGIEPPSSGGAQILQLRPHDLSGLGRETPGHGAIDWSSRDSGHGETRKQLHEVGTIGTMRRRSVELDPLIEPLRSAIYEHTHGVSMSTPTREEIDAKLAASEARNEVRFTEINGKLDRIVDSIGSLGERTDNDVQTLRLEMSHKFQTLETGMAELRDAVLETRADNKQTRWTIVGTVIVTAIAALGIVYGTQQTLLAAFQAGLAASSLTAAP